MKCFNHPGNDAVATCADCGKGLCSQCAARYSFPVCDNCNLLRLNNNRHAFTKSLVIIGVLFLIGLAWGIYTAMQYNNSYYALIVCPLMMAGLPWGWSRMAKLSPEAFLFLPGGRIVAFYLIKFLISILIGFFVAPFMIYSAVMGLKQLKQVEIFITGNPSSMA